MSQAQSEPTAQNDEQKPIQYEVEIQFSRELSHYRDDPELLESMLSNRTNYIRGFGATVPKDDIEVHLQSFNPESGAVILVGAEYVRNRPQLPEQIHSALDRVVTKGYKKQALEGDDLPKYDRRYVKMILDGEDRPRGARSGSAAKDWQRAKKKASNIDTQDGPPLGIEEFSIRTLEGQIF